jgi:hypothetical protein
MAIIRIQQKKPPPEWSARIVIQRAIETSQQPQNSPGRSAALVIRSAAKSKVLHSLWPSRDRVPLVSLLRSGSLKATTQLILSAVPPLGDNETRERPHLNPSAIMPPVPAPPVTLETVAGPDGAAPGKGGSPCSSSLAYWTQRCAWVSCSSCPSFSRPEAHPFQLGAGVIAGLYRWGLRKSSLRLARRTPRSPCHCRHNLDWHSGRHSRRSRPPAGREPRRAADRRSHAQRHILSPLRHGSRTCTGKTDRARLRSLLTGILGSSALAPIRYGRLGDAAGPAWATIAAAITALAVVPLMLLLSPRLASSATAQAS